MPILPKLVAGWATNRWNTLERLKPFQWAVGNSSISHGKIFDFANHSNGLLERLFGSYSFVHEI